MIRTTKPLLMIALACLALPSLAQIYKWKDESGRTVVSDKPPEGKTAVQKIGGSSEAASADKPAPGDGGATTAKPANAAKPGVDPELEKRKREQDARAKADKQQKDKEAEAARQENCRIAKGNMAPLEAGERIAGRDAKGERYYLDDTQRAAEIQRLRGIIAESCK